MTNEQFSELRDFMERLENLEHSLDRLHVRVVTLGVMFAQLLERIDEDESE